MSSVHLSPDTIRAYRTRSLAPAELVITGAHLASCSRCRSKVSTPDAESRALEAFAGSHLRYEDLESVVQGSSAGRFDEHLAMCPACTSELQDLRHAAQRRVRLPVRYLAPAAVLVAAAALVLVVAVKKGTNAAPATTAPVATLRDSGRELALRADGQLTGAAVADGDLRQAVAEALRNGVLPSAAPDNGLARSREFLLGPAAKQQLPLRPLSPIGQVSLSDQPTFRWESAAGAISFRVNIFDTNFNPVLNSPAVTGTQWTASQALKRGETYIWTVTAHYDFKDVTAPLSPEPEARFRVAPEDAHQRMDRIAEQHSDLLMAVEASRLGLKQEAEAALSRLAAANPGSPLIERLRATVDKKSQRQ